MAAQTFILANLSDLVIQAAAQAVLVGGTTAINLPNGGFVFVNTPNPVTLTLPAPTNPNQPMLVGIADRGNNGALNNITVTWTAGGGGSAVINTNGGTLMLVWDGTTFFQFV